jgi:hypothetical protein
LLLKKVSLPSDPELKSLVSIIKIPSSLTKASHCGPVFKDSSIL